MLVLHLQFPIHPKLRYFLSPMDYPMRNRHTAPEHLPGYFPVIWMLPEWLFDNAPPPFPPQLHSRWIPEKTLICPYFAEKYPIRLSLCHWPLLFHALPAPPSVVGYKMDNYLRYLQINGPTGS